MFDISQSNEFEIVSCIIYFNTVLDNFLEVENKYVNFYISKKIVSGEEKYKLKKIGKLITENVKSIKLRNEFFLEWFNHLY